jgi:caa(3)-type oxidase subunit IV
MIDDSTSPSTTTVPAVWPSSLALRITGLGLIALAAISWVLSSLGAPPVVALVIATVKALWIAAVFMELAHAHAVPRTIAVVAVLFVVLLCVGTLADVGLR